MSEYRNDVRHGLKEARWTFFSGLPLFVTVVVLLSVLGFGLNSLGLLGKTVVEREVFEQSYQRSESLKSEIATNEATLVELERQMAMPGISEDTRSALRAQAAAARIRIDTAKRKMQ